MIRPLKKYCRLTPIERWSLHRSLFLLPLVALLLRLLGFQRCLRMLTQFSSCPSAEHAATETAQAIARGVAIACSHGLYGGNCLKRSLTLWFLLRRRRLPGELRIGARKTAGLLEAHAWIEYQGVVLNDAVDVGERYMAFEGPVMTNNVMGNL